MWRNSAEHKGGTSPGAVEINEGNRGSQHQDDTKRTPEHGLGRTGSTLKGNKPLQVGKGTGTKDISPMRAA